MMAKVNVLPAHAFGRLQSHKGMISASGRNCPLPHPSGMIRQRRLAAHPIPRPMQLCAQCSPGTGIVHYADRTDNATRETEWNTTPRRDVYAPIQGAQDAQQIY